MFVASLIARPGGLEAPLVEDLCRQLGGRALTWLAPNEAAEFSIDALPEQHAQIWSDLQSQNVDFVVHPNAGRRKKILIADMDSTMIDQECIDELAAEAGVGAQVAAITARAMNGELDFEGALLERVGLLKGLPVDVIDTVYGKSITLASGGATLIATMKAHEAYTALVSGGFTQFTQKVASELGFDEHQANELLVEAGHLKGDVARPILGRDAKVIALNRITQRLGLGPADVIAVGDGANDLGMLRAAGMGVALHAKPAVQAQADVCINHGDLTALLYLQGYHQRDFIMPA